MTDDLGIPPAPAPSVGTPFPPPVLLFALILAGFGLRHFIPLVLPIGRPWAIGVGVFFLAAAVALGLASVRSLFRGGSNPSPHRPSGAIVENGVYRFTRNPIYLSMAVILVGVAMMARSGWHLAMAALFVVVIDRTQIRREERYLESRFGEAYRAYASRTRRWI